MKKTVVIFFFCLLAGKAFSQQNWGGGIDDELLHFGFTFQYVTSEYKIYKTPSWRAPYFETNSFEGTSTQVTDSLNSIRSIVSPGFGLGFVSNLKVNKHVDVRFTPTLVFSDRILDYEFKPNNTYEITPPDGSPDGFIRKSINSTLVEFPLGLKLKSDRKKNFRAYILGGAKYSVDIISKKKTNDAGNVAVQKLVKNVKGILAYEAGIGFDLYFEFFKLSPEFKLSNSINNVLRPEDHPYSKPIEKLFLRNFQFSLYFE